MPTGKKPEQLLRLEHKDLLRRHWKDFSDRKNSKYEKKSQLSDDELQNIAAIYQFMRDEHGYYPDGIDANGNIMWGTVLKSDVQMLAEKEADRYEKRGAEIMKERGGLGRALSSIKDELTDPDKF
jgi:hypothetical protein